MASIKSNQLPTLNEVYNRLFGKLGPQHWWPAKGKFEVMVGAILTQATNWKNVEKAIRNLKKERVLSAQAIAKNSPRNIEKLILPAGYFRQKTKCLKFFCSWFLTRYNANTKKMFRQDTAILRRSLLGIKGIGPETADSILLYAGDKPTFVVDAYTRRIFYRHYLAEDNASYSEIQSFALRNLPERPSLLNEFHALLVAVGKKYCHKGVPYCDGCPLEQFPHKS